MVAAIQSVMSGQLSIRKAAVVFNVPSSDMLLTPADGAKLAAYLIDVSKDMEKARK